MARLLSVKLQDSVFEETEAIVKKSSLTRNAYINEAVDFYNRLNQRKKLQRLLMDESRIVAASSMEVLKEFEKISDEDPD